MPAPRRIRGTVQSVLQHTPDTYSVTVELDKPGPRFHAGQFLHFALDPYDPSSQWPESRVFSIANSPTMRNQVTITYSIKGAFTSRMAGELKPGSSVWVKFPYGSFHINPSPAHETVMIAGGTGITPFISFLAEVCENPPLARQGQRQIRLFYGARSRKHLLFQELIRECIKSIPGFSCRLFIEDGPRDAGFELGKLKMSQIFEDLREPSTAHFYLAGPPEMMEHFKHGIAARGISVGNIFIDAWE